MEMKVSNPKLDNLVRLILTRTNSKVDIMKLFKLLYFIDLSFYKETGRTITGLTYNALPKGPVPMDLYQQIKPKETKVSLINEYKQEIQKNEYNYKVFTAKELGVIKNNLDLYIEKDSDELSNLSHDNGPWVHFERNKVMDFSKDLTVEQFKKFKKTQEELSTVLNHSDCE